MNKIIIRIIKFFFGYHKQDRVTLALAVPFGLIISLFLTLENYKSNFPMTLLNIPFWFDPIWVYGTIILLRCITWESYFLIKRIV